jgi:FAD/FMN-containing dehydrogenase
VDFGRVIHGGAAEYGLEDTVFLSGDMTEALRTPATEGAFEVLPRLVERFAGRVWIISKCGERTEQKTLRWLDHHRLYERTGLPRGNVRFCRERADKAIHCAELGITHMIDDRLDVHRAIRDIVPNRYLFGPQTEPIPDWVTHVPTWADAERLVIVR